MMMMTRILLALPVLATAFLTWSSGSPRTALSKRPPSADLSQSQQSEAHQEEGQVKEFKGKILKSGGKFVLEESSNGGNYGTYLLDDQATAKKYEGQRVVVIGTLDAPHNTIHVRKIEAVA